MVAEDSVNIGIYHAKHPAPGVTSYPFASDRVGLVVPIGHALANRSELFLEDALDYDLLGYFPLHSLDKFLAYMGQTVSRSEEHTSELQSLMRISYAVFCLKKKNNNTITPDKHPRPERIP